MRALVLLVVAARAAPAEDDLAATLQAYGLDALRSKLERRGVGQGPLARRVHSQVDEAPPRGDRELDVATPLEHVRLRGNPPVSRDVGADLRNSLARSHRFG